MRKLTLSDAQRENIEKHGVPIFLCVDRDGNVVLRLFAETAYNVETYSRYNELDGRIA